MSWGFSAVPYGTGPLVHSYPALRAGLLSAVPHGTGWFVQKSTRNHTTHSCRRFPAQPTQRKQDVSMEGLRRDTPDRPETTVPATKLWSWRRDLNPRPSDYKSDALPAELRQPKQPCCPPKKMTLKSVLQQVHNCQGYHRAEGPRNCLRDPQASGLPAPSAEIPGWEGRSTSSLQCPCLALFAKSRGPEPVLRAETAPGRVLSFLD